MNAKKYFDSMIQDEWLAREWIDAPCRGRYQCERGDYLRAHVNTNKHGQIFFYHKDFPWDIEAPEEYSLVEVLKNSFRCDYCDTIQDSYENLTPYGERDEKKICEKCRIGLTIGTHP